MGDHPSARHHVRTLRRTGARCATPTTGSRRRRRAPREAVLKVGSALRLAAGDGAERLRDADGEPVAVAHPLTGHDDEVADVGLAAADQHASGSRWSGRRRRRSSTPTSLHALPREPHARPSRTRRRSRGRTCGRAAPSWPRARRRPRSRSRPSSSRRRRRPASGRAIDELTRRRRHAGDLAAQVAGDVDDVRTEVAEAPAPDSARRARQPRSWAGLAA